MNIIMVMAASVNGKITKGSDPKTSSWTSKEDHEHFLSLSQKYPLHVMGRKTYEANRDRMMFRKHQLRIVLTRHPEHYKNQSIPDALEFTNESPKKLVKRLSIFGHKTILLLGGSDINTEFFNNKLVNELILTIEPKLFGKGISVIAKDCPDINLRLLTVKRLNPQGTLLCRYRIEY